MTTRRFPVAVTTASDGSATFYSPYISGLIQQIRYVKTDFADGSTITMTCEATGEAIWAESSVNASATRAPRQPTHTAAGVASLYASAGVAVNDRVAISRDRVKIVIASGGNVKSAVFHIVVVD